MLVETHILQVIKKNMKKMKKPLHEQRLSKTIFIKFVVKIKKPILT
jgi:hypothetical protein